jgi:hypothetical protein
MAFGMAKWEFYESRIFSVNDYADRNINENGVPPGAFLGWKTTIPVAYPLDPAQGDCGYQHFTGRCEWHAQLIFAWRDNHKPLYQAVDEANAAARITQEDDTAASASPKERVNP